jgi:regulator of sirC expression with transglutaminase-like and TPR domain
MNVNRQRDVVLSAANAAHPAFSAAMLDSATPLASFAALVAEELPAERLLAIERQLDFLAYLVAQAAGGATEAQPRLAALRRVLSEEEGFRGNHETYDDPDNSAIERVLERRLGLPISLGVIYLAVAQRLNWPLVGVDYPLHFLLRYTDAPDLLVIDPYHGAEEVDLERCVHLARAAFPDLPLPQLTDLARRRLGVIASPRRIVIRMLKNLEHHLLHRHELPAVKAVIEKLLIIDPAAAGELRDLGGVYHLMGEHRRALACLRGYLAEAPGAADREHVRAVVTRLRQMLDE